jgi:hypothetical protein
MADERECEKEMFVDVRWEKNGFLDKHLYFEFSKTIPNPGDTQTVS